MPSLEELQAKVDELELEVSELAAQVAGLKETNRRLSEFRLKDRFGGRPLI